ncbi:MAG: hypothetical protein FWC40_05630 [Proteobacteria bacterium]|nr:hypothetical protein [Pseudomonadota bacterium]
MHTMMRPFFLFCLLILILAGQLSAPQSTADAQGTPVSRQPSNAISAFVHGNTDFSIDDIRPIATNASGYHQKWEFFIDSKPYEVRIRFEISSVAFTKNEGKIGGHVKKFDDDGNLLQEFPISKTYKPGQWRAAPTGLDLRFGNDFSLKYENGHFHIRGQFEKGQFNYAIPLNPWKPGTGNVFFGNNENNVFKYAILTYQKPIQSGTFVIDGQNIPVHGQAYANHYLLMLPVYEAFDEVADFRIRRDGLLVEFRYYVPSQNFAAASFGFLMVAYEGQLIFSSTNIERTTLQTWLDDAHYGYEIPARQVIRATDGANTATFTMLSASPQPTDPYANLPAFQRNVATRFAKPITYSIPIDWLLDLHVDGYSAKIPMSNTYSMTRLR